MMHSDPSSEAITRISGIKRKVNEIALSPLEEHGVKFEEINAELTAALASVEGISSNSNL